MPNAASALPTNNGISPAQAVEDKFQALVDRGVLGDELKQAPAIPQGAESAAAEPSAASGEESPASSSEEYADGDEFLSKNSYDRDAFMALPWKIKVDGKESTAPLSKLVESYQLGEHLAHKSNAFAEERRKFEADREQARIQIGQQVQAAQHFTVQAYNALIGAPPTAEQYPDAGQLALAQLQFNQRAQALQQQYAQLQTIQSQVSQATVEAERAKVLDAVPEWRDSAKFSEASKGLSSYAQSRGFTPAELSAVVDHRYLLVLRDAALARDLQAQVDTLKKQLEGKTAAALKIVRAAPQTVSPGARVQVDPKRVARQQALERVRKNPRDVEAQERAFAALVEAGA